MAMLFYSWVVGLTLIFVGFYNKSKITPVISNSRGYRTKRSKSSKEAWVFGNKLSCNMQVSSGILAMIISSILICFTDNLWTISIVSLFIGLVFQIITEILLRRRYDKNGKKIKR
ncbi:MAG: SdpI family protein [Paraclostridium sp.]|uniref:SdpI family protein n=1 Tax=Paraclostridium sp. TaxID=2023273 RepID=UPI003F3DB525